MLAIVLPIATIETEYLKRSVGLKKSPRDPQTNICNFLCTFYLYLEYMQPNDTIIHSFIVSKQIFNLL